MTAKTLSIDVVSDLKRARSYVQFVAAQEIDKAMRRAINRTIDQVATEANRRIRDRYNVRARAVSRAMKKKKVSARAGSLTAEIEIRGRRIGLIEFAARQTGKGVSVKVLKAGPRKVVKGAFIATNTATQYRGVWRRVGASRYPIRNLVSISIPQAFFSESVSRAVEKLVAEKFPQTLRQNLEFVVRSRTV